TPKEVSMKKTQMVAAMIAITGMVALIIVAVIGGIRFSIGSVRRIFASLYPQVGIILSVACVLALFCTLVIASALRSAKRRQIENRTATERASLYKEVLESLSVRLSGSLEQPVLDEALLLKASTAVLKEYRLLLDMLADVSADVERVNQQVNRLVLAMRRDCGSSTYGWEKEDWSRWLRASASISPVQDNRSMRTPRFGVQDGGVAHRL